ncbi:hypothetical protein ACMZ5M_29440, partial [Streptomyces rhizosphaericola]
AARLTRGAPGRAPPLLGGGGDPARTPLPPGSRVASAVRPPPGPHTPRPRSYADSHTSSAAWPNSASP